MKKKGYIEPQYLYENKKPAVVYLSIEDYQAFKAKLEALSKKVQQKVSKPKKSIISVNQTEKK